MLGRCGLCGLARHSNGLKSLSWNYFSLEIVIHFGFARRELRFSLPEFRYRSLVRNSAADFTRRFRVLKFLCAQDCHSLRLRLPLISSFAYRTASVRNFAA